MRVRLEEMFGMFGEGGGEGGFELPDNLRGLLDLPERLPAPPVPAPVAPIRTAPAISKMSIRQDFGGAIFAPRGPRPVIIPEEERFTLPPEVFVRPPPRVSVPAVELPCPPGFVRS